MAEGFTDYNQQIGFALIPPKATIWEAPPLEIRLHRSRQTIFCRYKLAGNFSICGDGQNILMSSTIGTSTSLDSAGKSSLMAIPLRSNRNPMTPKKDSYSTSSIMVKVTAPTKNAIKRAHDPMVAIPAWRQHPGLALINGM